MCMLQRDLDEPRAERVGDLPVRGDQRGVAVLQRVQPAAGGRLDRDHGATRLQQVPSALHNGVNDISQFCRGASQMSFAKIC